MAKTVINLDSIEDVTLLMQDDEFLRFVLDYIKNPMNQIPQSSLIKDWQSARAVSRFSGVAFVNYAVMDSAHLLVQRAIDAFQTYKGDGWNKQIDYGGNNVGYTLRAYGQFGWTATVLLSTLYTIGTTRRDQMGNVQIARMVILSAAHMVLMGRNIWWNHSIDKINAYWKNAGTDFTNIFDQPQDYSVFLKNAPLLQKTKIEFIGSGIGIAAGALAVVSAIMGVVRLGILMSSEKDYASKITGSIQASALGLLSLSGILSMAGNGLTAAASLMKIRELSNILGATQAPATGLTAGALFQGNVLVASKTLTNIAKGFNIAASIAFAALALAFAASYIYTLASSGDKMSVAQKAAMGVEIAVQAIGAFVMVAVTMAQAFGFITGGPAAAIIAGVSVAAMLSPVQIQAGVASIEFGNALSDLSKTYEKYGFSGYQHLADSFKGSGGLQLSSPMSTAAGVIGLTAGLPIIAMLGLGPLFPIVATALIVWGMVGSLVYQPILEAVADQKRRAILDEFGTFSNYWAQSFDAEVRMLVDSDAFKQARLEMARFLSDSDNQRLVNLLAFSSNELQANMAAIVSEGGSLPPSAFYADITDLTSKAYNSLLTQAIFDKGRGIIDLSTTLSRQYVTSTGPLISPSAEYAKRFESGKNEFTSKIVYTPKQWNFRDGDADTTIDLHGLSLNNTDNKDSLASSISLNGGNDTVLVGARHVNVDGGSGFNGADYSGAFLKPEDIKDATKKSEKNSMVLNQSVDGTWTVQKSGYGEMAVEAVKQRTISWGKRKEVIDYVDASYKQVSYTGTDTLSNIQWIKGSIGDDRFFGGDQSNFFVASTGRDEYDGGGGADWIDFSAMNTEKTTRDLGISVSLDKAGAAYFIAPQVTKERQPNLEFKDGVAYSGFVGTPPAAHLKNIENLRGTVNADMIVGDNGNNVLIGEGGSDRIYGRGGNDQIATGGFGNSKVDGGAGTDTIDYALQSVNLEGVLSDDASGYVKEGALASGQHRRLEGRYVLIRLAPGTQPRALRLSEVEVMSNGFNVAAEAKVYASSDGYVGKSSQDNLVDDDAFSLAAEDVYKSVGAAGSSWVMVDLGRVYTIDNIRLTSGYQQQLGNFFKNNGPVSDLKSLLVTLGMNDLRPQASDPAALKSRSDTAYATITSTTAIGSDFTEATLAIKDFVGNHFNDAAKIDSLVNVENIRLGDGNDRLTGNKYDNLLDGGKGDDRITGGAGDDTILTGAGKDNVDAGDGDDMIVVDHAYGSKAVIWSHAVSAGSLAPFLPTSEDVANGVELTKFGRVADIDLTNFSLTIGGRLTNGSPQVARVVQNEMTRPGVLAVWAAYFNGSVTIAVKVEFSDCSDGSIRAVMAQAKTSNGDVSAAGIMNWNTSGVGIPFATGTVNWSAYLGAMQPAQAQAVEIGVQGIAVAGVERIYTDSKILNGGAGDDFADYHFLDERPDIGIDASLKSGTVRTWFQNATVSNNSSAMDRLIGIEGLSGTNASDRLVGDANANTLAGYGGDDFIDSADGNDRILTGKGRDIVRGGAGDDTIYVEHSFADANAAYSVVGTLKTVATTGRVANIDFGSSAFRMSKGVSSAEEMKATVSRIDRSRAGEVTFWVVSTENVVTRAVKVRLTDTGESGVAMEVLDSRYALYDIPTDSFDWDGKGLVPESPELASPLITSTSSSISTVELPILITESTLKPVNSSDVSGTALQPVQNDSPLRPDDISVPNTYGVSQMTLAGLPGSTFKDSKDIDGGDGSADLVDYRYASNLNDVGIDASLVSGTVNTWWKNGSADTSSAIDKLTGVEGLGGTKAADRIIGNSLDNQLFGYGGADIIEGGSGSDQIVTGTGKDIVSGGDGDDYIEVQHERTRTTWSTSWLSASSTTLSEIGRVADIDFAHAVTSITINGGSTNGEQTGKLLAIDKSAAGKATFWVGYFDGTRTNAIQVQVSDRESGGVSAVVLAAKYASGDVTGATYDWNKQGVASSIAANASTKGYGIAAIRLSGLGTFTDNKSLDGGGGADVVDYLKSSNEFGVGISASLTTGLVHTWSTADRIVHTSAIDVLKDIESIGGTDYADVLSGTDRANLLMGHGGDDRIEGMGGDDAIYTGAGKDIVLGGEGNDTTYVQHDRSRKFWTASRLNATSITTLVALGRVADIDFSDIGTAIKVSGGSIAAERVAELLSVDKSVAGKITFWAGFYDEPSNTTWAVQVEVADNAQGGVSVSVLNAKYASGEVIGTVFDWSVNGAVAPVATAATPGNISISFLTLAGLSAFSDEKYIDGGEGFDQVNYRYNSTAIGVGISASLETGEVKTWLEGGQLRSDSVSDQLVGIEGLGGTEFSDTLVGDAAGNQLAGYGGDDVIRGGDGDDTVLTGTGQDTVQGGSGDDIIAVQHGRLKRATWSTSTGNSWTPPWLQFSPSTLSAIGRVSDIDFSSGSTIRIGGGSTNGVQDGKVLSVDKSVAGIATFWVGYFDGKRTNALKIKVADNDTGGVSIALQQAKYAAGDVTQQTYDWNASGTAAPVATKVGSSGYGIVYLALSGLSGFSDAKIIDGGDGEDSVDYLYSHSIAGVGIDASLTSGKVNTWYIDGTIRSGSVVDQLSNIENIGGTYFADKLIGSDGRNRLSGYAGNDYIDGGKGDDFIDTGIGNDKVNGGEGNDFINVAHQAPDIKGRYVMVRKNAGVSDHLSLAELQVMKEGKNIALKAAVKSSGGYAGSSKFKPANLVDGVTGGDVAQNGIYASATKDSGWIQVDLGSSQAIDAINLYGRTDNGTKQSSDYTVYVSDVDLSEKTTQEIESLMGVFSRRWDGYPGSEVTINQMDNMIDQKTINGGDGDDTVDYSKDGRRNGAGIDASLANGTVKTWYVSGQAAQKSIVDTLVNVENLAGTDYADRLIGDSLSNRLYGQGGADEIRGGAGDDILMTGTGADTVYGDTGNDEVFVEHERTQMNWTTSWLNTTASVLSAIGRVVDIDFASAATLIKINGSATGGERVGKLFSADTSVAGMATLWVGYFDGISTNAIQVQISDNQTGGVSAVAVTAKYLYGDYTASKEVDWNTWGIPASLADSPSSYGFGVSALTLSGLSGFTDGKVIDGGEGDGDGVEYRYAHMLDGIGVDASLETGTVKTWFAQGATGNTSVTDRLTAVENIGGTDASDKLTGDAKANRLMGYAGDDEISGGNGNDQIGTGTGTDRVSGGAGNDTITVEHERSKLSGRYVLLRHLPGSSVGLALSEVLIWSGGKNVALNASTKVIESSDGHWSSAVGDHLIDGKVTNTGTGADIAAYRSAALNGSSWVMIDLGQSYLIDAIDLTSLMQNPSSHGPMGADIALFVGEKDLRSDAANYAALKRREDVMYAEFPGQTINGARILGQDGAARVSEADFVGGRMIDAKEISGGEGEDFVSYRDGYDQTGVGIKASLVTGDVQTWYEQGTVKQSSVTDKLVSVENLGGTDYADRITGDAGANKLAGFGGDDVIDAGSGDDLIFTGSGRDNVEGGDGNDVMFTDQEKAALNGRYLLVKHTPAVQRYLAMAEIAVWSNGVNVARNATVVESQDGHLASGAGGLLIDGSGVQSAGYHSTNADGTSWVMIDLGQSYSIDKIDLSSLMLNPSQHGPMGGDIGLFVSDNDLSVDASDYTRLRSRADTRHAEISGVNGLIAPDGKLSFGVERFISSKSLDGGAGEDLVLYKESQGAKGVGIKALMNDENRLSAVVYTWYENGAVKEGSAVDLLYDVENLGGTDVSDYISGNSGANKLIAYDGDDILIGGAGNDELAGGAGSDTYRFSKGWGTDVIYEDADSNAAFTDKVVFEGGIGYQNLWFQKAGDALVVNLLGSSDNLVVDNWYSDASARVERFECPNGYVLQAGNIDAFVDALSQFGAPPASIGQLSTNAQSAIFTQMSRYWATAPA